jgi:hypothetical protein
VYREVVERAGIPWSFTGHFAAGLNVLANATDLQDAVLYVFENESVNDAALNLKDAATGVELSLTVPADRAALVIIDKRTKQIVAKYGF